MKIIRPVTACILAFTAMLFNAFTQPAPVDSFLVDPAYPKFDDQITVYVNTNHWPLTTDDEKFSAWTGLITEASSDLTDDWLHNPISDWFDISVELSPVDDVSNDSVFKLEVTDIASFYSIDPTEETVFRLAFIARGHSGGSPSVQTENIYFEIFGSDLSAAAVSYPASPIDNERIALDFNIKAAANTALYDEIIANPGDKVYAHTGINTNLGEWQHVITDWGENIEKNTLLTVSDSIYRLFIEPNTRDFYSLEETEEPSGINVILRDDVGGVQTEDYYFEVTSLIGTHIINQMSNNSSIRVFPNPASEFINIDLKNMHTSEFSVSTLTGQLIYSATLAGNKTHTLNIADFTVQSGLYFYRIINQQGNIQGQLLVLDY